MKSSKETAQDWPQIVLPFEIKTELKNTLDNLKFVLKDNPDFLFKLLNRCMLVGKTPVGAAERIFFNNIEDMIREEYPEFLKYEAGHKLLQNAYKLVTQVCLNSKLIMPLINNEPLETQLEFRRLLEEDITHFLNNEEQSIQDVLLIGDIINE